MRITNYLTLVGHGLHRGFVAAEVLFTAAAATAMCFSGAVLTTIHNEKTEPCELSVTAPSYLTITEQSIQDFHSIDDVVDATGIVEVPVIAAGGKYTASITLVGIDGEYLNDLVRQDKAICQLYAGHRLAGDRVFSGYGRQHHLLQSERHF